MNARQLFPQLAAIALDPHTAPDVAHEITELLDNYDRDVEYRRLADRYTRTQIEQRSA